VTWPPEIGQLLPNADEAYGICDKLARYSLKAGHPKQKAEGFAQVLGITTDDLEYLTQVLLDGARTNPVSGIRDRGERGVVCDVVVPVRGLGRRTERVANVLTGWEIRWDGDPPRLVTAFVTTKLS
jgi:Domain of unknown function (DUF6883)